VSRHWTIRVRLTLLYGGLFLAAGAALLGLTYLLVERSLDGRFARDVDGVTVAPGLSGVDSAVTVRLTDGREVSVSEALRRVREQQKRFREDTLDALLTQGAIALAGVGVIAGAFGWLVAGRALQPMHRITETARRIAAAPVAGRGLHERIALSGPRDEVTELADTFDSMLERIDHLFDGQRRFVANASHELRTPLALNRALVELAVTRADAPDETRRLGESLLAVNERHERLIDGLLTLAESDNGVSEHTPVDLAEVARHVVELAADDATAAGVHLASTLDPAPLVGDPVLLERLMQNLVENGIRYNTPPSGTLTVRTGTADGVVHVAVANTGRPVPRYEIETLFQPFRRGCGERTGRGRGVGLGLSIVRAVARAHGGDATAEPRDGGGGLVVTVTLPASR
jgi:signal transduction histidine kinase